MNNLGNKPHPLHFPAPPNNKKREKTYNWKVKKVMPPD